MKDLTKCTKTHFLSSTFYNRKDINMLLNIMFYLMNTVRSSIASRACLSRPITSVIFQLTTPNSDVRSPREACFFACRSLCVKLNIACRNLCCAPILLSSENRWKRICLVRLLTYTERLWSYCCRDLQTAPVFSV